MIIFITVRSEEIFVRADFSSTFIYSDLACPTDPISFATHFSSLVSRQPFDNLCGITYVSKRLHSTHFSVISIGWWSQTFWFLLCFFVSLCFLRAFKEKPLQWFETKINILKTADDFVWRPTNEIWKWCKIILRVGKHIMKAIIIKTKCWEICLCYMRCYLLRKQRFLENVPQTNKRDKIVKDEITSYLVIHNLTSSINIFNRSLFSSTIYRL